MKKLGLILMPLITISLLASCNNGGSKDPIKHTLKFEGTHCEMHDTDGKVVLQKQFEAGQTASFFLVGSPSEDFDIPKETNVKLTITGTKDPFDGTYSYNPTDGSLTIKMTADVTVTALSEEKPEPTPVEWYEDNDYLSSLTEEDVTKENPDGSIGEIKTVEVNGQIHKVRLIGVDADVDENGNTCHTTWEFANLISDANGYSLATYWENTSATEGSNSDYRDSSLRKALTGDGMGDLHWFEKDSKKFSDTYDKSVLDMLPATLKRALKIVKKTVNVRVNATWTPIDFTDKLFLLSPKEAGYQEGEGSTYKYYEEFYCTKTQVNGAEEARTTLLSGTDLDGDYASGDKYSSAGYNTTTFFGDDNAPLWFRSPDTKNTDCAWFNMDNGMSAGSTKVYSSAYGVAPAFCL